MKTGTVKFFNESKGFGFIKEDGGQDVFFHVSALSDHVRENDTVKFEVEHGNRGPQAVNVTPQ